MTNPNISTRREFIRTSSAAAATVLAGASLIRAATPSANSKQFSFVLLGDLHYDKLEHHDLAWVKAEKPNDVRQIEDYTRITRDISPRLLATVRETITELNKNTSTQVA